MTSINSIFNHVWQSTLFTAVVVLLTLALKNNQAHWRGRLWLAASVKFLIPFAVLAGIGSGLGWRTPRLPAAGLSVFVEEVALSIETPVVHQASVKATPATAMALPTLLLIGWFCGFAVALLRWWLSWRRVRAAVREAVPLVDGRELEALQRVAGMGGHSRAIRLMSSTGRLEPGVFGVFRAVLLWPAGFSDHLADAQLEAIMAHELCHVRRRDNLTAALHMLVEAVFWFHPLVWWLGTRLVDEREKACDEEVLRMGSEPEAYAESILKTCQFQLEAPRMCMAGVTGSDLKKRIERIMSRRTGLQLDWGRKLLLAGAAVAAIAGPIVFGVGSAPAARAQSPAAGAPAFEVASIKPNNSDDHRANFQITPGGRVACTNITPKMLITMAYSLKPNQLTGAPSWMDSTRYDVTAKAAGPDDPERLKLMMRTLLAERFKLAIHRETKEMPIYELVVGKNGAKLHASAEGGKDEHKGMFRIGRGEMDIQGASMAEFADNLSHVVGRNVYDRTGIAGTYDIKLQWTPEEGELAMFKDHGDGKEGAAAPAADSNGPSLFGALQEQLGLKLEATKGAVELVVIDHIEKATEN